MRQNSDTPRAQRYAKDLEVMIADEGDPTLVNGIEIQADWMEELASRVQAFLNETEWGKPVYSVNFPGRAVLDAPYTLTDGTTITWITMGWQGVVRRISPDTSGGILIGVTALVVIM